MANFNVKLIDYQNQIMYFLGKYTVVDFFSVPKIQISKEPTTYWHFTYLEIFSKPIDI